MDAAKFIESAVMEGQGMICNQPNWWEMCNRKQSAKGRWLVGGEGAE
jgi:hypothetical protein